MKGLSSILKSSVIFCLLRGWQGSHAGCVVPNVPHSRRTPTAVRVNSHQSVTYTCVTPRYLHIYGSLTITCTDREDAFDREPPVCGLPEYVLYAYENISISGGLQNSYWPLSRCLQACNEDPACEAVDWDGRCWFHYSSSSCNRLRFVSNVRHYQMKQCPGYSAYNCPCSTGGTCIRTYTSWTQIPVFSEECVCNLGRNGYQCLGFVECTAPTFPNAAPSPVPGGYRFNSTVTYTCNSGYQLRDGSGNSFTLTCGPRGTFKGERKTCNRTCDLPVSDHLRQVTQRSVTFEGQTVTYTCDTGFQFNKTSTVKNLTCQADGTFDQSLPSCVPISCAFPTSKLNLKTVEGPYVYMQNVTFSCIPGYHFAGYDVDAPFTSQCIATNTLEPRIPDCIKRTCTLPHLNNTVARAESKGLFFMKPVEFKCRQGFQFPDGNTSVTLTCDETGGFGVDNLNCTAALPGAGNQAASTGPNIGVSVGVGVTGAIVLILLVVIVVVFIKRRRKQMSNSHEDIDVSSNGKLSSTMYSTSNTHVDTNLYELEGECPMAGRYDQSNNMRQNSNYENQASDSKMNVQDLYALPDKSKKTKKGKKQQNTPASYPDDAYEYVSKPSVQPSSVSRQDCSSTYELAGQFQNGDYTQSIDDADDVEFVENDIYEAGGVDNMGHTCVESVENDIYNSSV